MYAHLGWVERRERKDRRVIGAAVHILDNVRYWDHKLAGRAGSSSWRMAFSNAKDYTSSGQGTMWAWVEGCLNLNSCQKLMLKLPM